MIGRVTIYVDSEIVTTINAEIDEWLHRETFFMPRKSELQLVLGKAPDAQVQPIKAVLLKVLAKLEGCVPSPYLCLFCYNYDNPTTKQIHLDIEIAQGQMRKMLCQ